MPCSQPDLSLPPVTHRHRIIAGALAALLFAGASSLVAQDSGSAAPLADAEKYALFEKVVANQKKVEESLDVYERLERVETRKNSHDPKPISDKSFRVIPAGTGNGRIPVRNDGQPLDPATYRADLQKLVHQLAWAAESGRAQTDAYAKIQKKRKERDDLISAGGKAFNFIFVARESRGNRTLLKFRMSPNPAYKPPNRTAAMYSKVRGFVWIDEAANQLARIQGETIEDVSLGIFLARVYKGSYFMQERYEIFPGCWLPTFAQYDFDGRKLFMNFSIHERTFYTRYRYIGPPREALQAIQKEERLLASSPPK